MTDTSMKARQTRTSRKQLPTKTVNKPTAPSWSFDDNPLKKALDTWQSIPNNPSSKLKKSSTLPPSHESLSLTNTTDVKDLLETIKKKLSEFS